MPRRIKYADEVQVGDWIRTGFDWSATDFNGNPVPFMRVVRIRETPNHEILSMIVEDIDGNQREYGYNVACPVEIGALAEEARNGDSIG